jgi:hypothetical protein
MFALLDPDPDSEYGSGSGSTDPIESGSNSDPDPDTHYAALVKMLTYLTVFLYASMFTVYKSIYFPS